MPDYHSAEVLAQHVIDNLRTSEAQCPGLMYHVAELLLQENPSIEVSGPDPHTPHPQHHRTVVITAYQDGRRIEAMVALRTWLRLTFTDVLHLMKRLAAGKIVELQEGLFDAEDVIDPLEQAGLTVKLENGKSLQETHRHFITSHFVAQ